MPELFKPEFVYQPWQALKRVAQCFQGIPKPPHKIKLPWGLEIEIDPTETIGRSLWRHGVYDLALTESLVRLTNPEDVSVNVGANIGYFVGLSATKCSLVYGFEPHPLLFKELKRNCTSWETHPGIGKICVFQQAISSHPGEASLIVPPHFAINRGVSFLSGAQPDVKGEEIIVSAISLDGFFEDKQEPNLMIIDVECAEFEVLRGMSNLLRSGNLRDIFFEDYEGYPSKSCDLLESFGYRIFLLQKSMRGPNIVLPNSGAKVSSWEATNYLATNNPLRALERINPNGWSSLKKNGCN
ncbi:MAG: FkbM family methyltransferase [Bdellovibrionales bacterium]|nr:FkbM family methyltransferase [Bdellovibrionales bacterium]